jgi:hypothetical protein
MILLIRWQIHVLSLILQFSFDAVYFTEAMSPPSTTPQKEEKLLLLNLINNNGTK